MTSIFDEESDWGRCYAAFLRSLRTENTRYRYRLFLEKFFTTTPQKAPHLYTKSDVESFIHKRLRSARNKNKPLTPSPSSVNFRLSAINSFYSYASTFMIETPEGTLTPLFQSASPALGIKHPKRVETYRAISLDDLKRLFDAIPLVGVHHIRNRALLLTYLLTSKRREEIVRLTWGDIFETVLTDEHGNTKRARVYRFKGKGRTGYEVAELAEPAWDAITWYLVASGRIDDIKPTDAIFVGHSSRNVANPTRALRGATVLRMLKGYAEEAGLDPASICIHLLRHLSAQRRYLAGQGLMEISKALGHSHVGITHRYVIGGINGVDTGIPLLERQFADLL